MVTRTTGCYSGSSTPSATFSGFVKDAKSSDTPVEACKYLAFPQSVSRASFSEFHDALNTPAATITFGHQDQLGSATFVEITAGSSRWMVTAVADPPRFGLGQTRWRIDGLEKQ